MKFTGERYVPNEQGVMRVEYYHRCAVAMLLAKDKRVLDLACGEGYESALLSHGRLVRWTLRARMPQLVSVNAGLEPAGSLCW